MNYHMWACMTPWTGIDMLALPGQWHLDVSNHLSTHLVQDCFTFPNILLLGSTADKGVATCWRKDTILILCEALSLW